MVSHRALPLSTRHLPRLASLLVAFSLGACGGETENLPPKPPEVPPARPTAEPPLVAPPVTVDAAAAEKPALPPVALLAGVASPDPTGPAPTVAFVAPKKDQVIPAKGAGDFEVKLDVKNWQTATGSQHVHLILDNHPYKAIYDTKAPIKLSALPGGEAIGEGQHVLVAFPSRPSHESLKTKGAFAVTQFYVGKKEGSVDIKKPMLVYSRPKGEYKGEMANHVLVDFQLANVTLAEGKDAVRIGVTGPGIEKELSAKAEKFGPPFYLDNLQNGTYTLKVELVGADGKAHPGPWNVTTRDIKIDRDAPAEDPHAHAMGAPDPKAIEARAAEAKGADAGSKASKPEAKTPAKADPEKSAPKPPSKPAPGNVHK
jgi:hypothetical protein